MNRFIVVAVGKGIVTKHNKWSLKEYGGTIELTKHWAESILHRMKFVKRRGSTKVHLPASEFDILKENFLHDIRATVFMEDIPPSLIKLLFQLFQDLPGQWLLVDQGGWRLQRWETNIR